MSTEILARVNELKEVFEDFKVENNKLLETNASDQKEKVNKISDQMNSLEGEIESLKTETARSGLTNQMDQAQSEYNNSFYNEFIRKGDASNIDNLAVKASLSVVETDDGGATIPEELDRNILKLAENQSPMREYCTVMQVGGSDYKKLVQHGNVGSGWVGEKAQRPETGTPTFSTLTPIMGEIYANPSSTQKMLDDAFFDVESWLVSEGGLEFIRKENEAFVSGDGVDKPKGILTATLSTAADDTRPFGTIQQVNTGVADALPTGTAAYDFILDLQDGLKDEYKPTSIMMVNPSVKTALRQIKDADGNYIWENGKLGEAPSSIFGIPVITNHNFPVVAAGSLPILFGDLKRAYTIIDRIGTRMLRDPFTNKPFVQFYMTKRVGSMIVNTEAVRIVKCAA